MNLNRGGDRVWRQRRNDEPLASSPEDEMIAAEEAKEREGRIIQAVDKMKGTLGKEIGDESKEETLEGKSE